MKTCLDAQEIDLILDLLLINNLIYFNFVIVSSFVIILFSRCIYCSSDE